MYGRTKLASDCPILPIMPLVLPRVDMNTPLTASPLPPPNLSKLVFVASCQNFKIPGKITLNSRYIFAKILLVTP